MTQTSADATRAVVDASQPVAPAGSSRRAPPATVTVFGASGDLAARKLYPALAALARDGLLPSRFALVGAELRVVDVLSLIHI